MEFSFLFICFVLQFHSAFAFPTDRWHIIDEVGTVAFPGQNNLKGFECGNDFFGDSDIKEALSMYHHHVNQNRQSPLANHASPVNPIIQQFPIDPNEPQELYDPLEVADLDVRQYLDLDEFEIPLGNNIPQEHQSPQQHFTPIVYQGPLYSDSGSSNYILWPIQNGKTVSSPTKYSSEPYYMVIEKNSGDFIDVIARIKNNDLTKCIRMDGSRTELSPQASHLNNGYQCASEFLSDTLIQKSLGLVLDNIGKFNTYPISYVGRLYPANSGYMMWPILSRDGLYDYNSVEAGPYFLVIDWQGNYIETVVEGLAGNFLRCSRSRQPSKIPLSNAPNHLSEPDPVPISKYGYYCGRDFFSDQDIMKAVEAAKIANGAKTFRNLPAKFNGPPFNKPLLLWPLMKNGRPYERGSIGIHRLVLTRQFNVKAVAIMVGKQLQQCEKGMMEEEKDHDKNDYYCFDHIVLNRELVDSAEKACISFLKRRHKFFPAKYEGPGFKKNGPYYTYPVIHGLKFAKRPGKDRVVINLKCEVVGALTTIPKKQAGKQDKRLVLCIKFRKGLVETFIEPDVAIAEHSREGKY